MANVYCAYCGYKTNSVSTLTNLSCPRHPNGPNKGKHILYEGSEKTQYVCKYCGKHTYVRFYSNRGGNAEKHSFYYTKKTKAEEIKKCELCNRKIIRKKIKKGKWSNWKLKLGK